MAMKLYSKVEIISRGLYTTLYVTEETVKTQNITDVTPEDVSLAATTSYQATTSQELTTPEIGNNGK